MIFLIGRREALRLATECLQVIVDHALVQSRIIQKPNTVTHSLLLRNILHLQNKIHTKYFIYYFYILIRCILN